MTETRRDIAPRWLGRLNGVQQAALALVAVQLLWRLWASIGDFFRADDFIYLFNAEHSHLGWHYLTQPYNGHLMPGQFLLVWLMQHLAPSSWAAATTLVLVLQVAVNLAMWRLLSDLFGTPPGVLIPYVVFLFSPLTLASYLWWAAALEMLPLLLAMTVTLRRHLAHLRSGSGRDAAAALLAYGVGLLFWEKALLILPLVVSVSVLFPATGRTGPVLRTVFLDRWRLWLSYLLVTAAYVALYLGTVGWPLAGQTTTGASGRLVREMLFSAFLPGLFGGPWAGRAVGGLVAAPPAAVAQVLTAFAALLVGLSLLLRKGAARAWLLLLGYLALDALLLAGGRLHMIGPIIGRDTRYIADAVPVAALAVGLALLPLRDGPLAGPSGQASLPSWRVLRSSDWCWCSTSAAAGSRLPAWSMGQRPRGRVRSWRQLGLPCVRPAGRWTCTTARRPGTCSPR
ncbi:MAG: hypothetical protein WCD35_17245 [Mycobacteriales bacterium]